MRPIVTDVAWSVDHNRTAKPTEVSFWVWTWVINIIRNAIARSGVAIQVA